MSVSSHAFTEGLFAAGGSPALLREIHRVNFDCGNAGVTPLYTLGHLAFLSAVPHGVLRRMLLEPKSHYTEQRLAKKKPGTGYRTIRIPSPALLKVQRFILGRCLPPGPSSPISYAYTRGRGIRDAAERHVGARTVIKLDYSDFFSSVGSKAVYRVFELAGYPELLAFEMAMLCTYGATVLLNNEVNGNRPYKNVSRRFLAQGAPTSGALSNFALRSLDKSLGEFELSGFTLTRYADDITISSARTMTQKEVGSLIRSVSELSSTYNLSLNKSKTQVLRNKNSFRILGLSVTSSGVGLTRPYKRSFEAELFGIRKGGLSTQAIYRGYSSPMDYIAFLWGHVAFAKGIDPIWSQRMSERLESMGVPFIDAIGVFGSSLP